MYKKILEQFQCTTKNWGVELECHYLLGVYGNPSLGIPAHQHLETPEAHSGSPVYRKTATIVVSPYHAF